MVCTLSFDEISNIHDGLHIRLASALLIQRAEASRGNVFYNELGDHVSRVEVYVLPAIGITC